MMPPVVVAPLLQLRAHSSHSIIADDDNLTPRHFSSVMPLRLTSVVPEWIMGRTTPVSGEEEAQLADWTATTAATGHISLMKPLAHSSHSHTHSAAAGASPFILAHTHVAALAPAPTSPTLSMRSISSAGSGSLVSAATTIAGLINISPIVTTPIISPAIMQRRIKENSGSSSNSSDNSIRPVALVGAKRRAADALDEDSHELTSKRPMLMPPPPPVPVPTPAAPLPSSPTSLPLHFRALFQAAAPQSNFVGDFVSVLPSVIDPKRFEDAHTFAKKYKSLQQQNQIPEMEWNGATAAAASSSAATAAARSISIAPIPVQQLHLDGVQLIPFISPPVIPAAAAPTRPRFKLKCPPTSR